MSVALSVPFPAYCVLFLNFFMGFFVDKFDFVSVNV